MKIVVFNNLTLDGVIQAPTSREEDQSGGFELLTGEFRMRVKVTPEGYKLSTMHREPAIQLVRQGDGATWLRFVVARRLRGESHRTRHCVISVLSRVSVSMTIAA